jgi:Flp pilus assembly protein TadG
MTGSRLSGARGSAGVSVVLLTPAVLALLAFAVLAGRVGTAHQDVVTAAQAAARAASLRQSPTAMVADARTAAETTLRNAGMSCGSTAVDVATAGAGGIFTTGVVTATVSCQVALADLVDLALPGQKTITARASAPLDRYRGGT